MLALQEVLGPETGSGARTRGTHNVPQLREINAACVRKISAPLRS